MQKRNTQRSGRRITGRPQYITGLRIGKLEAFEDALKKSMESIAGARSQKEKNNALIFASRRKEWFKKILAGWIQRGELNQVQMAFAQRLNLLIAEETNETNLVDIYRLTCSLKEGVH